MTTRPRFPGLLSALALLVGPAACTLSTEGTLSNESGATTGAGGSTTTSTTSTGTSMGGGTTTCVPDSMLDCYSGPAGTEGKGICKGGTETCNHDGSGFGECAGEVLPQTEDCNNALDDDCDGEVNDGCSCTPGETADCYDGPDGTEGVGPCAGGTKTCNPDGKTWGPCMGEVVPAQEDCATADDEDCDGKAFDDADSGCVCAPGSIAACDTGLPGVCAPGSHTCDATGTAYGMCVESVQPSFDDCVTAADEDCDGAVVACTGGLLNGVRFGGASDDAFFAVAVDAQGNAFIGGTSKAQMSQNGYNTTGGGSFALLKLDPNGSILWQKVFDPANANPAVAIVRGVATDAAGDVFAFGTMRGDIDFGGGPISGANGSADLFVVKYAPDGTFLWNEIFGDQNNQFATACAVDDNGNLYLTGGFGGTINFGGGNLTTNNFDIFVASLDGDGNYRWQKKAGDPSQNQEGWGIAATPDGGVVVVGQFDGKIDFGGNAMTSAGGIDAFVAKLNQSDGSNLWSKRYGDGSDQVAYGVAVDPTGAVATTGVFAGQIDFGNGAMTSAGGLDAFVARLDKNGNASWSKRAGDASDQTAFGVAVDPAGNVVAAGSFAGALDFGGGVLTPSSSYDVFVTKLQGSNGNHVYSNAYGDQPASSSDQDAWGVAIDGKGNAVIVGDFQVNLALPGQTLSSSGGWDAFAARLKP